MAVGVEKLKDSGFSGLLAVRPAGRRHGARASITAPAAFSLLDPAYCAKYGVTADEMRDAMTHVAWKNHANGARNPKAQFRTVVSKEKIAQRAERRRAARGVRLLRRLRRGRRARSSCRAEDARRYTERPMYVKALSLVAGHGAGPDRPAYDYTTFPEVVRSARDAYPQAGINDPADRRSRWPRCTIASPRPRSC